MPPTNSATFANPESDPDTFPVHDPPSHQRRGANFQGSGYQPGETELGVGLGAPEESPLTGYRLPHPLPPRGTPVAAAEQIYSPRPQLNGSKHMRCPGRRQPAIRDTQPDYRFGAGLSGTGDPARVSGSRVLPKADPCVPNGAAGESDLASALNRDRPFG
jgi:hypothetical protein